MIRHICRLRGRNSGCRLRFRAAGRNRNRLLADFHFFHSNRSHSLFVCRLRQIGLRSSCFLGTGLLTDNNRSDGQRLFLDLFEQVAGKQPGIVGFHHFGILYGCRKEKEQSHNGYHSGRISQIRRVDANPIRTFLLFPHSRCERNSLVVIRLAQDCQFLHLKTVQSIQMWSGNLIVVRNEVVSIMNGITQFTHIGQIRLPVFMEKGQ